MAHIDASYCTYFKCRHQTGRERLECRAHLRALRIRHLDHLIGVALEEKAQLLADRFRNLDLMEQEDPPASPA